MAGLIRRHPLRFTGRRPPRFRSRVHAIVSQQPSGKAADDPRPRALRPQADARAGAGDPGGAPEELPGQKAAYLRNLADPVRTRRLDLPHMHRYGDEEIIAQLTRRRGRTRPRAVYPRDQPRRPLPAGPPGFVLSRPDVLPVDDLVIREAFQRTYRPRGLPTRERMERIAHPCGRTGRWPRSRCGRASATGPRSSGNPPAPGGPLSGCCGAVAETLAAQREESLPLERKRQPVGCILGGAGLRARPGAARAEPLRFLRGGQCPTRS